MRKKGAELVFLGELPDGEEVIDFYHAAGHLDTALAAAYGDTHPKRRAQQAPSSLARPVPKLGPFEIGHKSAA